VKLGEQDREALAFRLAGEGLKEIGASVGWSTTKTCLRSRELGSDLAERCGIAISCPKESSGRETETP
jgi:hypothetical protein